MSRKIRLSDHQIALLDEAVKIASDWWVTAAHQAHAANMPAVEEYAVEMITAYEEMRSVSVERITVRVRDTYEDADPEPYEFSGSSQVSQGYAPEWTL
jgi:hypothetical protein